MPDMSGLDAIIAIRGGGGRADRRAYDYSGDYWPAER